MILHDRAIALVPTITVDRLGNGMPGPPEPYPIRCSITPIGSDEALTSGGTVHRSRYRVICTPGQVPFEKWTHELVVQWQGVELYVDGHIERHMYQGRLHHLEFVSKEVTF